MEVTFLIPAPKAEAIFASDWKQISEQSERLEDAALLSVTYNNSTLNVKNGELTSYKDCRNKSLQSAISEPSPRWGHFFARSRGELCALGGCLSEEPPSVMNVYTFDLYHRTWQSHTTDSPTTDSPPTYLYEGACASARHHLYLYGGYGGYDRDVLEFHDTLYRLDCRTWEWSQLGSGGDAPMKKMGCRMISYDGQLVLFGGYGISSKPNSQPGTEFLVDLRFSDVVVGWTNEFHVYDPMKGLWSAPTYTGSKPPPCSDFSLTMVEAHGALLFGGSMPDKRCTDHLYFINLACMHWSKLEACPVGKSDHAAVCLGYTSNNPQLFVVGGRREAFDEGSEASSDAWIFNMYSRKWKEIKVPDFKGRFLHSATVFTLTPGLEDVVLFGGCSERPKLKMHDADYPGIAKTTVLRLESHDEGSTEEWALVKAFNP